ncbi:MAG: prepilin-type N-terminal cleavage/methylation domain-containing protein [Alicyclobacillaceae bacterium]|nr:prepilin-type N-terminal cleavage/methylation domain-containing protein [Alicyclobacillaceae bacterium]
MAREERPPARPPAEGGFTLIEVVVAVAVLSVAALAVIGAISTLFPILRQAQMQTEALRLAEQKMEEYQELPFFQLLEIAAREGHVSGVSGKFYWTVGITPATLGEDISAGPGDPALAGPTPAENADLAILQVKVEDADHSPWSPILLRSEVVPR